MRQRSVSQMELRAQLVEALEAGQLRLHYQPIVSLHDGATVGYEALLRWEHPTRGLLLPAEFLPVIIDSDLDLPVTRWVLNRAVSDIVELSSVDPTEPFVSVNLSARQLARTDLDRDVQAVLARSGLAPHRLWLELTEEHLVDSRHRGMLERLRGLGCQVVLDDFGTGYSGLTYLQQLPVGALKIDRAFIARVGCDRVSTGIIRAVADLADALDIAVVAEGVETTEQAERVAAMGIKLAQGYLFGRPGPLAALDAAAGLAALPTPRDVGDRAGQPPLVTVNDSMTTG